MENTVLLSLHLLGPNDILRTTANHDATTQRATLYARLSHACRIANELARHDSFRRGSRGDGWIFGVHCFDDDANVEEDGDDDDDECMSRWNEAANDCERRRISRRHNNHRRGRPRQPHLRAACRYASANDAWHIIFFAFQLSNHLTLHQLECAIRCIDASDGQLILIEAAEVLPSWVDDEVSEGGAGGPPGCEERCWIVEGKVRLIPPYCRGDGMWYECNVAPKRDGIDGDFARLDRTEALWRLRDCIKTDKFVVHQVQDAIQSRIERTNYYLPQRSKPNSIPCNSATNSDANECTLSGKESHYHIAAVALPATVAYFLSEHWYLIPFFVESFCQHAPQYRKERQCRVASKERKDDGRDDNNAMESKLDASSTDKCQVKNSGFTTECDPNSNYQNNSNSNNNNKHHRDQSSNSSINNYPSKYPYKLQLGTHFPYERIVLLPFIMTRTTYAELITGRGIIPSFPIPEEYRSVELNRFQRQLRQMITGWGDEDGERRKNVWKRAVEIGVRLCAGLEWTLLNPRDVKSVPNALSATEDQEEKLAFQSMGEIERRLRLYWCRIDAEASGNLNGNSTDGAVTSRSWIEQTWQAGPNNDISSDKARNKVLIEALQSMSKCPVFHPELSKSPHEEPCPYTRPGVSLHDMTHSGMRRALKWVRDEYSDASFPFPREWEVDDDSWMEVNSLEELEDEMRKLSYAKERTDTTCNVVGKSRRVTRRSRRNRIHEDSSENVDMDDKSTRAEDKKESEDATSLNKMLHGFKSLVEGEGELGGVVTRRPLALSPRDCLSPQQLMSEEVNIDARVFLNILHEKLRHQTGGSSQGAMSDDNDKERASTTEEDMSKFFFKEDLEDDSSNDSTDSNNTGMVCDELDGTSLEQDPGSMENIMRAMDQELRTATAGDPSLENIGAPAHHNDNDSADYAMLSNFLKSLEAEGTQPGPVTNILREMGICPPRLSSHH
ncbi:hypothetical protein ACHAW6_010615 [Cyclotella cf. meneghiniana]